MRPFRDSLPLAPTREPRLLGPAGLALLLLLP